MTAAPETPWQLLRRLVAEDSGRPLFTYYDDVSRVELSRLTAANWVAKTANFFVDVVGLEPGDTAELLMPTHWRTAVALMGAWAAGVRTRFGLSGAEPMAVVVSEDRLAEPALAAIDAQVIGVALAPLSSGLHAVPGGVLDFDAEVRAAADTFGGDVAPDSVVHETPEASWTARELTKVALEAASGGRVLCADHLAESSGLVDGLLAGLGGGGVVLCAGLGSERLREIAAVEVVQRVVGA